jgi:hypothetical protein
LASNADFDVDRGQEATPLIIDGVMYVSTAWSNVIAENDSRDGPKRNGFGPSQQHRQRREETATDDTGGRIARFHVWILSDARNVS